MASYRRLPSGRWQAVVKHPSGRRYTQTDALKKNVVMWAEQKQAEIRRGDFVDPSAARITLEQWWDKWVAMHRGAKATVAKRESVWRNHLLPAFGAWPLDSIHSWDVEAWSVDLASKPSLRNPEVPVGMDAQASAVRLLKQLLADAVRHKLLRVNPAEGVDTPVPPKHVDRFLSIEEADRLLAAVTRPGEREGVPRDEAYPRVPDPVNRLFVQLMLEAGLRWQEVAGLHVFRVDLMRKVLTVKEVAERGRRIKVEPKSRAGQRVVPLTDDLVVGLSKHLRGLEREGLVFDPGDGRPLDYPNWLKRVWGPSVAGAELADPQPTPHDCRHSYGSWLAEEGVPPTEIRDLMGHGSLRAVERYLHSSSVRLQRARDALSARRKEPVAGAEKSSGRT